MECVFDYHECEDTGEDEDMTERKYAFREVPSYSWEAMQKRVAEIKKRGGVVKKVTFTGEEGVTVYRITYRPGRITASQRRKAGQKIRRESRGK